MTFVTMKQNWVKLLVIPMLIVVFSFTSVALAQEGTEGQTQQTQPTDAEAEFFNRTFASPAQRGHARDRDLSQFDTDRVRAQWCASDWVVREGENLFMIAAMCNIPVQNILAVNPQIGDTTLVFTNEIINMPTGYDPNVRPAAVADSRLTADQQESLANLGGGVPVTGEGTDADDFSNRNFATIQQRRLVQHGRNVADRDSDEWRALWCTDDYIILPGESIADVVVNCSIPINILLAHNPQIINPSLVFPGEVINIPADPFGPNQPQPTRAQLDWLNQNFDWNTGEQEGETDNG